MSDSIAAVVLCAGKGTRMKSARAKVLHPLLGVPMGAYPLARALEVACNPVVAVVGHQADDVRAAMKPLFDGAPLVFAEQREQRGTADAVRSARDALGSHEGPVLILYGDTPLITAQTLRSLVAAYQKSGGPLAFVTTEPPNPHGYGRVLRDFSGSVQRVIEQKDLARDQAAIRECNAGLYAVDPRFLWESLAAVSPSNAQAELYLTDLVQLAHAKKAVVALFVPFDEVAGVNDRAELAASARVMQARINAAHMKAGVTMADPLTTYVEEGVQLAADVELGPMVSLRGRTRLSRGVTVGQGCVLTDSAVAEDTQVKPYSVMEEAQVGPGCVIGPFARLRPGTVLADQVHLGNFVETKKARIGSKSKANHLSYLGDAEIGSGVNVGAGTITCNYDGVNKHQTVIEDGVFVGSDTQLVAPVRVGEGSYVGAGTTVTEDVPPRSLAISRAPQVNKAGWATKRKQSP